MTDYSALREAIRNNPELPLTWDQVIVIDESFDQTPQAREELVRALESIQATETGQEMLRRILTREDQDRPLTIDYEAGNRGGSAAFYDSAPHSITMYEPLFSSDFPQLAGRTMEQYLVHELGHGVDHAHMTYRDANLETMEDFLFLNGHEEWQAEEWVRRYNEETGQTSRTYYNPQEMETRYELHVESGFDTKEGLAEKMANYVIVQSTIDGLSREETLARLDEEVARVREEYGIDLSEEVAAFLRSPAPEFDDNDHIITPDSGYTPEAGESNSLQEEAGPPQVTAIVPSHGNVNI